MSGPGSDPAIPATWANRRAVISTLWELVNEFEENQEAWENTSLPDYLEALAALLDVIERSYAHKGSEPPTDPWTVMADALRGARFYE